MAHCVSWGDPHVYMFNGTWYDVFAAGLYTLFNYNGLNITIKNEGDRRAVSKKKDCDLKKG